VSRDSAGGLRQHEGMRAGDRRSTGSRLRSFAAVALVAVAPVAAAQTAITTQAVTMRAGPAANFPSVTTLMGGTSATVIGCEGSWRWCDVSAGRDRGWVSSRYLSYTYKGNKVTILNGGPTLELPLTEFSLAPYWNEHYRERVFFGRQAFYQSRWDRRTPAPEWRAPRSAATAAQRPAP
jgi:uncharacterized protein YraI